MREFLRWTVILCLVLTIIDVFFLGVLAAYKGFYSKLVWETIIKSISFVVLLWVYRTYLSPKEEYEEEDEHATNFGIGG